MLKAYVSALIVISAQYALADLSHDFDSRVRGVRQTQQREAASNKRAHALSCITEIAQSRVMSTQIRRDYCKGNCMSEFQYEDNIYAKMENGMLCRVSSDQILGGCGTASCY